MDANTAATYALIYHFLKHQSQNKAAEAVKKAARSFVVLRDDLEQEGPPLEDIIKEWMAKRHTKADTDSSSEDSSDDTTSDSEDSSSSNSSSGDTSGSESEGDSNSGSDEPTQTKKPQKAPERDTSVTLSSAGENTREIVVQAAKQDKSTNTKNKTSESVTSESDGSSEGSASDAESSSSSSDSSSPSDSSDKDEANETEKAPESSSDSEDEPDSTSQHKEDAPVAKKRKTMENGTAVITARVSHKKENPPLRVRQRFQRVKVQNLAPDLLLDNGYEAKGGARNDYGERAHRDLMVTRGAGFRKEKNKKKRGSYRGGEITMENHSIRFDF